MKNRLTFAIVMIAHVAFNQMNQDIPCYKIEYLDFFGLNDILVEKWPDEEIQGFSELVNQNNKKDNSTVSFIVPLIVYQLQEFHPKCTADTESIYLKKIIGFYLELRGLDSEKIGLYNLEEKIDFIRDDFYELVKDNNNLIAMNFTLDDGPLFGTDTTLVGDTIKSLKTDFGSIVISKSGTHSLISSLDSTGNLIWNKIITGAQGRDLSEINTGDNWIEKTSLATRIFLFAEGEQLTLYIRNNGEFMYYYHSW